MIPEAGRDWDVLRAFHAVVELVVPVGQPEDDAATNAPVELKQAVPAVCACGLTKPMPGTLIVLPKFVTVPALFWTWLPGLLPAINSKPRSSLPSGPGLPENGWVSPDIVPA